MRHQNEDKYSTLRSFNVVRRSLMGKLVTDFKPQHCHHLMLGRGGRVRASVGILQPNCTQLAGFRRIGGAQAVCCQQGARRVNKEQVANIRGMSAEAQI